MDFAITPNRPNGRSARIGLLLALIFSTVSCSASAQQPAPAKNVLIILSYSDSSIDDVGLLESALRARAPWPINFYVEHLEGERFPDETYEAGVAATFQDTYTGQKLDLVMPELYPALGFVMRHRDKLFPTVPVVFVGIDSSWLAGQKLGLGITGVTRAMDVGKTIDLALHLHPGTSTVAVITGKSFTDAYYMAAVHGELVRRHIEVKEIDLVGLPTGHLLETVAALPHHTIVLFQQGQRDSIQPAMGAYDILAWVGQHFPTYCIFPGICVDHNGVGGDDTDEGEQLSSSAEIATRVLAGARPEDIPAVHGEKHEIVVDWRALHRWHIPESALPPGSVVKFKPASLWELYKWEIVGIVVFIALLLILIAALLANLIRRRRAEASLKGMAGQLLHAQDEERRRMARDLHDGTAQDLTGISLCLGEVLEDSLVPKESRHILEQAHELSRKALQEVRSVSYALHPPMLDGTGLVPALRWYFDGLMKRSNLRIRLDAPSRIEPMAEIDSTLFRIVQESMSNILRHSGANTAQVKLERGSQCVRMSIEDNGHGMGAESVSENGNGASLGVGIAGMRERVRQFGGTFEIRSGSTGTTVLVSVPISEKAYAANHAGG